MPGHLAQIKSCWCATQLMIGFQWQTALQTWSTCGFFACCQALQKGYSLDVWLCTGVLQNATMQVCHCHCSHSLHTANTHCHLLCSLLLGERSLNCSLMSDSPINMATSTTTRLIAPTPICIAASCKNPDLTVGAKLKCLLECWLIQAAWDSPACQANRLTYTDAVE